MPDATEERVRKLAHSFPPSDFGSTRAIQAVAAFVDKETLILRAEIERLSRELQEAKEALKPFAELEAALDRIANVVGEDEPSIMWPWAQEIARSETR